MNHFRKVDMVHGSINRRQLMDKVEATRFSGTGLGSFRIRAVGEPGTYANHMSHSVECGLIRRFKRAFAVSARTIIFSINERLQHIHSRMNNKDCLEDCPASAGE